MTQQINLYDESLRPKQELLTLFNVALGLVIAVLLLMGLASLGMLRERDEMHKFQLAEAKLREAQEQLSLFAAQHNGKRMTPELEAELAEARLQLAGKQEVLAVLRRGDLGNTSGFHAYMLGLAKVDVDGVWLTSLDIEGGGHDMALRGRMLNESLLPRYVQRLSRESVFVGKEFSALDIQRVESKPENEGQAKPVVVQRPYVEFVLGGRPKLVVEGVRTP